MNPATLRQLEYFVAAVDTGTLSAAAARCSASQAAVSTALQDLERGLGMQLLLRRPSRGVAITPGGERVLPLARRILADADELARVAGAEHDELSGPLRLASTIALSPRVLPVLADAFAARHPRVRLELTDALATSVQELLRAGTVDACLLYRRQLAHRFDVHPVCSIVPYAVLAEDHPLAGAEEVLLEQLKDERLIIVQPAGSRGVIEALIGDAGVVPRPGWSFSNPETVRAMVARGLGYSVFSGRPVGSETFDGRRVAHVRVADAITPNEIVLATPRGQRPNARVSALFELLDEPEVQAAFG